MKLAAPSPRWLWLAVPPLAVASVLAVERLAAPPADVAPRLPPAALRTMKLPDDAPRTFDDALARADAGLAAAKARVAEHPGEWVFLEGLSRRWSTRARLTGSFDDYAAAQAALDQAFALAPAGSGPHLTQAALHFTLHRLDAAERTLDAIDRYAVPPDAMERAEAMALRGDIAFYRGDLKAAQTRYRAADALESGAGTAFRWAVYFTKTGRLGEAERFFDAAVRASRMPTMQFRANVELQKGTLYLERGQWDRALSYFGRADALFPGYYVIQEHIAEALTLKGQAAEAEAMYADIVRRTGNPEFMDALAGIAEGRGDAAGAAAWRAKAATEWERRLKLLPEAAYGHALDHYLAAGDPERALEIARRNHAARPNGDSNALLAEALLKAGRPSEARQAIEPVLKTAWNTAQLHGVAAQVYAAAGDRRLAARERARALAINPHELDDATALPKVFN
ncbi:tetratricopeptide repeat protein [Phenylobacterium sp.]|uniref:tetratricopeptide repeat protein n=1 Tax=Phenylobacterium sp. TaxID=1871053 RepID=UPI0025FD29C5|nr:tetratricopeptide repeat protein [Phenylobacterium sp.]MBX3485806.1 tetratricopeptide repeat protein [Phenylobacterium sp.]